MKIAAFFCVIMSLLIGSAHAQSDCAAFESSIEHSLKIIALTIVEGMHESAPRATNRKLDINNQLQLMNLNLQLMIQNKCPPRKTPISTVEYLTAAAKCATARLESKKEPPACDLNTWSKK